MSGVGHSTVKIVAVVLALSLGLAACGGGGSTTGSASAPASAARAEIAGAPVVEAPLLENGVVSKAALDAVVDEAGQPLPDVLKAYAEQFLALPPDQQNTALADLSARAEAAAAANFGLGKAIGDPAATEAALAGVYAQIQSRIDAGQASLASDFSAQASQPGDGSAAPKKAGGEVSKPGGEVQPGGEVTKSSFGGRNAMVIVPAVAAGVATDDSSVSAGAVGAMGLFMGYMGLVTAADVAISGSNDWTKKDSALKDSDGLLVGADLDQVGVEIKFDGKQDGVDVKFRANTVIHPCPKADGSFDLTASIEVFTSKGGVGQNTWMDLQVNGTVDDNADIASKEVTNRSQWADFGKGKSGQYIDFTFGGPDGVEFKQTNRERGDLTDDFVKLSTTLSVLMGLLIQDQLVKAAQRGWKSGRCVELKLTPSSGPSGLKPSEVVDVTAEPISKIDGTPTGGMVTGTLASGGQSFEPDGSPVPAVANGSYTAPDQQNEKGTVKYESRSKRGIGKADITFSTSAPAAYKVVGGLQDWKVNMVVCDVMKPFTLESPGIGTADFSGGLTGTYSATGIFDAQYAGTYEITLENGPGSPGKMVATSGGSVAGQAGSGSERYVLTPTTC